MAKGKIEIEAVAAPDQAVVVPPPAAEPLIIIEKYLATREDIPSVLRGVLCVVYRNQVNTTAKWVEIVNKRISKSAD